MGTYPPIHVNRITQFQKNVNNSFFDSCFSCFGVKGMVGRSKDSGPFQLLRRESMSKGVNATFADDGSISLELHIAVDHGVNISALAHSIINEVSYKVNQATGVPVARVDVYVDTMFLD